MPLKDLVADHGKITEEIIEKIIADYVRYDPSRYEVVFTPEGNALANDSKILVYLVAVLGWQYVASKVEQVSTKPADLESVLGIAGGTLRPTLKKLKDAHLLSAADGHYSIRPANLDAVARTISGAKATSPARRPTKKSKSKSNSAPSDKTSSEQKGKGQRKSTVPIRQPLSKLVKQGFFKEYRTLSQVVDRLHEQAIIAKNTSLSGPVAELVRDGTLERKKTKDGGKGVWGYKAVQK